MLSRVWTRPLDWSSYEDTVCSSLSRRTSSSRLTLMSSIQVTSPSAFWRNNNQPIRNDKETPYNQIKLLTTCIRKQELFHWGIFCGRRVWIFHCTMETTRFEESHPDLTDLHGTSCFQLLNYVAYFGHHAPWHGLCCSEVLLVDLSGHRLHL